MRLEPPSAPFDTALRSAPAQKVPFSPKKTPTSASSSCSNERKAAASASAVARSTAFFTSGLLRMIVVTGPFFSVLTASIVTFPELFRDAHYHA